VFPPFRKVERVSIFYVECDALRGYHSMCWLTVSARRLSHCFLPSYFVLTREVLWRFFGGIVSFSLGEIENLSQ
jgi:hypothetical protein